MNFSFCLQAWIWLCRGAVRSTKRSRVCKPSPETPPSLPGVGVGSAPTDTPDLSQALCSQRAASRPGQHFGGVHVPWPELRSFPAHRGSQHGAFEPFAPVPWKQELSWLCHSRVCKNASRKSLQTWLRIPTKQTFLFPLLSSFPWPVQTGRGRRLSCPRPVEDGDFGEGERERAPSLPNHFASTAPYRRLFAAGTGEGRGCVTKAEPLRTYRTQIFAIAAGRK